MADHQHLIHILGQRQGDPIREIGRLVLAGGKRLRPAFTYWGFVGAGGIEGGVRNGRCRQCRHCQRGIAAAASNQDEGK